MIDGLSVIATSRRHEEVSPDAKLLIHLQLHEPSSKRGLQLRRSKLKASPVPPQSLSNPARRQTPPKISSGPSLQDYFLIAASLPRVQPPREVSGCDARCYTRDGTDSICSILKGHRVQLDHSHHETSHRHGKQQLGRKSSAVCLCWIEAHPASCLCDFWTLLFNALHHQPDHMNLRDPRAASLVAAWLPQRSAPETKRGT